MMGLMMGLWKGKSQKNGNLGFVHILAGLPGEFAEIFDSL
jgi:hypothetical protein